MSTMKHLKTFQLWESAGQQGEYDTDKMSEFVKNLAEIAQWGSEEPTYKRGPYVNLPSKSREASSVAKSAKELTDMWQVAVDTYGKDEGVKWYVWEAKVGGNFNKPKAFDKQRFDIDSIITILHKHPDAFRGLNIGVKSKEQDELNNYISKEFYGPGKYGGD